VDSFQVAAQIRAEAELGAATLMLLTSDGKRGDIQRCRELGIPAYLIKPFRQSELRKAISRAIGRSTAAASDAGAPDGRAAPRRLRVLVAEDNAVNQKLAIRLLEKRGHLAEVAPNGRAALDRWADTRFDLILMDVQMPEMNGLEAARAIREREAGGRDRVPIIAMTAHAMSGDEQRCLDAGMDAYITKPVQPSLLFDAIDRLVLDADVASPAFSLEPLLHRLDGDRTALRGVQTLAVEAPLLSERLSAALGRGDVEEVRLTAHALKGMLANFDAAEAIDLAEQLERLGRSGSLDSARPVLEELEIRIAELG
jgi:CheY-like chemotaxis protein/HPt (histidine-containing phosphotransfer) domain-containing protein